MDERERCPKYPSMLKTHCSHCQGTAPGTGEKPRFSLKHGHSHRFPTVEILKNGGPVHVWDKHFRFGPRKAEIIIACVAQLRGFWHSTEDQRLAFEPQVIENQRRGLHIQVFMEMQPDFEHSTGLIIERPWLSLQALRPDSVRIGLGPMKCRAICAVESDLRDWLRECGIPE